LPKMRRSTGKYHDSTPQLCLYPPSTAQSSQNFIPIVPILLLVHIVKGLSYTPRNLSLVKNLIPPGGIIEVLPCTYYLFRSSLSPSASPSYKPSLSPLLLRLTSQAHLRLHLQLLLQLRVPTIPFPSVVEHVCQCQACPTA
jgi:hypothetical protein